MSLNTQSKAAQMRQCQSKDSQNPKIGYTKLRESFYVTRPYKNWFEPEGIRTLLG